ncbi:hypothetical protein FDP41_001082 [Naegleria fowleri]|uniref:Uncharacterized protein n=1 Tax=Naegleria fowleri TaxID=5763 RepID=A0A6A5C3Q2_NAEFO|nr:uncharacterized protein FDP41_001082 [Naegleria fowleri]KAF0979929.1 hypothetical protein FDP41_001082 [Naegleria fowleri]CAG4712609.1 unnamed protein product [Naegleria fowleri]
MNTSQSAIKTSSTSANNHTYTSHAQPLSYQQKKRLKLAIYKSKFRHPLGYESKTITTRQPASSEICTSRPIQHSSPPKSSSTRSYSWQHHHTSYSNNSDHQRPASLPPIVKNKSACSHHPTNPKATKEKLRPISAKQRKEWNSNFANSGSESGVIQQHPKLSKKERREIDLLFAHQHMAYLKASNIIASLENPELKLEPRYSFTTMENNNPTHEYIEDDFEEEIIDWYHFNIERLTNQYMHIPDFPTAKCYLRKLWDELAIPLSYQGEFEIDHFQSDSITNRTFLFSEITTIESFRDRLRVALIWLHGKSEQEIEENVSTWTRIVETFREDYQYLYKTTCFLYNNRNLFALVPQSTTIHDSLYNNQ